MVCHTNKGSQFISREYDWSAEEYGFRHTTSSPYYPKGSGRAEAVVKVSKSMWLLELSAGVYRGLSTVGRKNTTEPSFSTESSVTQDRTTVADFCGGRFPTEITKISELSSLFSNRKALCPLLIASSYISLASCFSHTSATIVLPSIVASKPHTAALSSTGKTNMASTGLSLVFEYCMFAWIRAVKPRTAAFILMLSKGTGLLSFPTKPNTKSMIYKFLCSELDCTTHLLQGAATVLRVMTAKTGSDIKICWPELIYARIAEN